MPPVSKVTGKSIRYVRHKLFQSMSQPKFAKFLSKQTGELITPVRLARFEAYGKRGAANPEKPTLAVEDFIIQQINSDSSEKSNSDQKGGEAIDDSTSDTAQNDDEEPHAWRGWTMTPKELVKKVIDEYSDMGLAQAEGETALEMIQSIKTKIRETEKDLLGSSESEAASLSQVLKALDTKEKEIDAELEKLRLELASLNGSDSIELAGVEEGDSA